MLPTIGVMVGLCIITHMVALVTRTGERAETVPVKILAAFTAVVTVFCMAFLLLSGLGRLPFLGRSALQQADASASASMDTIALSSKPSFDPSRLIQLELSFTGDCWVEVTVDKTSRLAELRVQGETLRLSAEESISLTLGNAGAVSATLNGKPLNLGREEGEMIRGLLIDKSSLSTRAKRGPA